MDIISELKELNVNTDEALSRFMNNRDLYVKMLMKFPANIEKLAVLCLIDTGDYKGATENAHTIKGVTGNLSLTPLYTGYTEIVNRLRADDPEEARKILVDLMPVQEQILSCIKKYIQ